MCNNVSFNVRNICLYSAINSGICRQTLKKRLANCKSTCDKILLLILLTMILTGYDINWKNIERRRIRLCVCISSCSEFYSSGASKIFDYLSLLASLPPSSLSSPSPSCHPFSLPPSSFSCSVFANRLVRDWELPLRDLLYDVRCRCGGHTNQCRAMSLFYSNLVRLL